MRERISRLFRNRGGAVIAGVVAAVLAIILLVVYLNSYRSSVNSNKAAERVLVATKVIAKGTSGDVIAKKSLYQVTAVQKDQLKVNAITDPVRARRPNLGSRHLPGPAAHPGRLHDGDADGYPVPAHRPPARDRDPDGLGARRRWGRRQRQLRRRLHRDVRRPGSARHASRLGRLRAPARPSAAPGNFILRVPTRQAARFAFASDNTKIWLVLRPQVGASRTPPTTATLASLLAGAKVRGAQDDG